MYTVECDRCKKTYCPDCYVLDGDDTVVVLPKNKTH